MTKVLAILDGSVESRVVTAVAGAVADAMGAEVETRRPRRQTPRDELVGAIGRPEVVAAVLGFLPPRPGAAGWGSLPLDLCTVVDKPLVLVPPKAPAVSRLRRVLVPVEGDPGAAASIRDTTTIQVARDLDLEIVVLHVRDAGSLPMFDDQPQYETDAWAQEFLARYVSVPAAAVRLELRIGTAQEQVPAAAIELDADLIALGWLQDSSPGHAAVIRSALQRCDTPVLLVPLVRRPAPV
jgi:hypothetical protein